MLSAYLGICLGVVIAVLYPVLRGYITKAFPPTTAAPGIPEPIKKYGGSWDFQSYCWAHCPGCLAGGQPRHNTTSVSHFCTAGIRLGVNG
jgi:hypothetical protein